MKEIALEVNELLQLQFVDGDSSHSYVSRVDDVQDKQVYIAWPTEAGLRAPVRKGEVLSLSFTREDAVYAVKVKVESTKTEPLPTLVVQAIGPVQRTQRRENVRVHVSIPVELVGVIQSPSSGSQAAPVVLLIKTNTLDFSGGGLGFQQREAIPLGTVLEARFSLLGNPDPFKLPTKVVRCASDSDAQGQPIHRIGLMFLDMHESMRSRIIRYVFGAQNSGIRR